MQRTLKDGRTDRSNRKWFGRVWGIFTRMSEFFFTRIIAEYHGKNVILGKLRNAIKSTNKKKKSVMLSDNPCEFASWQAFTQISEFFHTDNCGVSRTKCNLGKIEKCHWIDKQEKENRDAQWQSVWEFSTLRNLIELIRWIFWLFRTN